MTLTKKELLCIMWALIESEPELCYVPDETSPVHVRMLNDLPFVEVSDDDITKMFQKLAKEYTT